jgi:GPI transamidase subunit PIG-U
VSLEILSCCITKRVDSNILLYCNMTTFIKMAAFAMILAIFRPVQVLFDGNMALIFLLFSPRSLSRMGLASFISLCCILVPVILNVVDNWMWLSVNNGNANYMFFQCLAYNVFWGIILAQFTSASMQRDKALRIIDAERKNKEESKLKEN